MSINPTAAPPRPLPRWLSLGLVLFSTSLGCEDEAATFSPTADYSLASIAFDRVSVTSRRSVTIEVTNIGSAGLQIVGIGVPGQQVVDGQVPKFEVELADALTGSLAPQATSSITVTYTPCPEIFDASGQLLPNADFNVCSGDEDRADLAISDNTDAGGTSIAMSGTPVLPPSVSFRCSSADVQPTGPSPACNVTNPNPTSAPCSLSFGKINGADQPCDLYVTIENNRRDDKDVAPLVLESGSISVATINPQARFEGGDVGFFLLDEDGSELEFPIVVEVPPGAPAGTEVFRVRYTGTTVQDFNSNVFSGLGAVFVTNDPDQPLPSLRVSGSGTAPDIFINRTTINFGDVAQGVPSDPEMFTISNNGDVGLSISGAMFQGADNPDFVFTSGGAPLSFPIDLAPRNTLDDSDEIQVEVVYTPSGESSVQAQWLVSSNDPDEPTVSVGLLGGPTPELCFPPSALQFPPTSQSAQATANLALESCGTGILEITRLEVRPNTDGSTSVDDFRIDLPGCEVLPCDPGIQLCPQSDPTCTISGANPGIGTAIPVVYQNNDISQVDFAQLIVETNDPLQGEFTVNLGAADDPCLPPNVNLRQISSRPCVPEAVEVRVEGSAGGSSDGTGALVNCDYEMQFDPTGTNTNFTINGSADACTRTTFLPQSPGGIFIMRATATNSCGRTVSTPPLNVSVAPNCN